MLGPCWRFFRSWARLGRIFRVLLRLLALLVAFLAFWNALGTILEPPGLHFHGSWDLHAHIFLSFFAGCACLRTCVKTSQKLYPPPRQREVNDFRTCTYRQHKIASRAFRMRLLTNIVPQACFGSPQACFWRGLGASWVCLRRNLDALGELESLGCLCAVSWPPFGCFLGALGRIWAL